MVTIFSYKCRDLFYQFPLKTAWFTDYAVFLEIYVFYTSKL